MSKVNDGVMTLDEAMRIAQSEKWYGQTLLREAAGVLAKKIQELQGVKLEDPNKPQLLGDGTINYDTTTG